MNDNFVDISNREIATSRIFNATCEEVFKAWSDSTLLAAWWGPKGFTNTFHTHEFKAGGKWSFIMHGPNGVDYQNDSEYIEIIPNKKIVFKHLSAPFFYVIATFDEVGTDCKLTTRMLFESEKMCESVKSFCLIPNEENNDKLSDLLPGGISLKEKVRNFFDSVIAGKIDEAYELYVSPRMIHHNFWFKGDRDSLKQGMKESHVQTPLKKFQVQKILQEGCTVWTYSLIKMKPEDTGMAVMHIFRFENGKIAEFWDMGSQLPENMLNENGAF
jgi:predicted SnoaL-like aldol condensation-catalyzing enzyme